MVKVHRRYLLIELCFTFENQLSKFADSDVYHAICDQVAHIFGDYGVGAIKSSFQVKVYDMNTNIMVLRISASGCNILSASLPFVITIGTSACTLHLIFKGSSMRALERYLIQRNLDSIYQKLRTTETPAEKSRLRTLIRSVTGSKIKDVKF